MVWKLLLFGLATSVVLFVLGWWVGSYYAEVHKQYCKEFKYLQMLVFFSDINMPSYKAIESKFIDIKKYDCRDDDEISVLEADFYNKFKAISTNQK
jgi:hypothetical protein